MERTISDKGLKDVTEIVESDCHHLSKEIQITASKEETDTCTDSSSTSISKHTVRDEVSMPTAQGHLTKLNETHDTSLEKEKDSDHVHQTVSKGLELLLSSHECDGLSPVADESIAISHKDSLEASPVLEDNSSRKTPDSLEPSPTKESPCRDSLESSPVEQKSKIGILPGPGPIQTVPAKAEHFPELAPVRSRLLRDPDGSAEDDSLEQTSLMESSGKSPLSPETPSSEEISYEITPKLADSQALSNICKSAVIPEVNEEPEDDSEGEQKKRFTPEEEMFKMVTKIKMFGELEQEAKQKRDCKKDSQTDDIVSTSDLETTSEAEVAPPATDKYNDVPAIVTSAAESRKTSSSSESEPELTKLKKEADSGLLMDPVIRVQPPSPHLCNMDSSSSPEETEFQPIEPKQQAFSTEEENTESDKPTEEAKMSGDTSLASDASIIAQASESKCYSTDESDTVSPNGPVMHPEEAFYHSVGDDAHKVTDLNQISEASHHQYDSEEDAAAERVLDQDLTDTRCTVGSCEPGASHCCASKSDELATDVSPMHSPSERNMVRTDIGFEMAQRDSCSTEHSSEYSSLTTQKGEYCSYIEDADEGSALTITSPYENVPSQHFFTSTEISTGIDSRMIRDQLSGDDCSAELKSTFTDERRVTGSLHRPASEGYISEEVYMEIESKHMDVFQNQSTPMPLTTDPASLDEAALQDIRDEAEKIISQVIITRTDVDSDKWSEIREDDDAFEARVKAEEQKIFGLMVDRRSQGTTPDTTPARTPTEEGTPTSEQNPFLFQEGKLFEMTRSGAIDMTKRNYSDENLHFFQMGQQSQEEVSLSEEMREAEGLESPQSELSLVPSEFDEADTPIKSSVVPTVEDDSSSSYTTKGDVKSRIPIKMGISASSKSPKKETAASDADLFSGVDTGDMSDSSQVPFPISPEQTVIDVQLDFSTVTRSVYSEQEDDSPDSSPEEQKSVIEIPTAVMESMPPSEGKSKIPIRTTHHSEVDCLPSDDFVGNLEESQGGESKPKSKIPVKGIFQRVEQECMYTETSVWKPESPKAHDITCKHPIKQDSRSKSESDASASMDSKAKHSVKARSYAEAEAEARERVGEMKLELESDELMTAQPKIFSSRLPIKSRSTSASRSGLSPSKENKQDDQERTEERLAHIADHLGFSWTELARELDFTEEQIHQIRIENPNSLQDQSHALLKYWLERDGKHATDSSLTECLTKINRMDIVHLMESNVETSREHSHTYAEIEQTIGLDHSEGFSVLHEDLCSTKDQKEEKRSLSKDSEQSDRPPLVSEEDISVSYSSFHEGTPRAEAEIPVAELLRQAHRDRVEAELSGKPHELPEDSSTTQEYFVTTSGQDHTQAPKDGRAASVASEKSECSTAGSEDHERPYLHTPTSSETTDSPIVQEPEDHHFHHEDPYPRKTSLVIVESTDEHSERYEEELLEKADDMPEMPPEAVTEEQYTDEHGHIVVKKVTRKIIRRFVLPDGTEKEEVVMQGAPQEPVTVEEGDEYSRVIKRVVLKSDSEQTEVTFSEPSVLSSTSEFQSEPVEDRKVSKVVKTTLVHGERLEKHHGDSSLAADLPSAKDDFEADNNE